MSGRETDKGVGGEERPAVDGSSSTFSFSCLPCKRLSKDGLEDLSVSRNVLPLVEGPGHGSWCEGTVEDGGAGDKARLQSTSISSVRRRLRRAGLFDNFPGEEIAVSSSRTHMDSRAGWDDPGAVVAIGLYWTRLDSSRVAG
jgi:hypothetical protein